MAKEDRKQEKGKNMGEEEDFEDVEAMLEDNAETKKYEKVGSNISPISILDQSSSITLTSSKEPDSSKYTSYMSW